MTHNRVRLRFEEEHVDRAATLHTDDNQIRPSLLGHANHLASGTAFDDFRVNRAVGVIRRPIEATRLTSVLLEDSSQEDASSPSGSDLVSTARDSEPVMWIGVRA